MSSGRPLVVLSDVHLAHEESPDVARALTRLVARYPGHEIVLAGDVFNLSCDEASADPVKSALAMLRPHATLLSALRQHLAAGHPITLLAGNHDAGTMRRELRAGLLELLELDLTAPFENLPWFVRRGEVHIEHGHVYDPDNAPAHPLFYGGPETEPLGVALTRRFLAPNRAFNFAHEHQITPLAAIAKTIRLFGFRTPQLVESYFRTAAALCWEAGVQHGAREVRRQGESRVAEYAELADVPEAMVRALLEILPTPTHESPRETFFRLYFDRVAATLASATGLSVGSLLRNRGLLGLGFLGAGYLFGSVRKSQNRYGELPVERLREAAAVVGQVTRAKLVIFGHVHVEDVGPGYVNSASFRYHEGVGRPYLRVTEDGNFERRRE